MLYRTAHVVALLVLLSSARGLAAGQLRVDLRDGRITVDAQGVTSSQILDEWARIGDIRILKGEELPGTPITLQLDSVPESQALEALLRPARGYVATMRRAATANASAYERILIVSTGPLPAAGPPDALPAAATPEPAIAEPEVVELTAHEQEERQLAEQDQQHREDDAQLLELAGRAAAETASRPDESTPAGTGTPFGIPATLTGAPGIVTPPAAPPTASE
jgi:hypothetical protein